MLIAALGRRHGKGVSEQSRKMALIGKSYLFGNVGNGKIRLDQQLSCQIHAALQHIAGRSLPCLFGEEADKMIGMQMADRGKKFIGKRVGQMLVDIGQNLVDPAVFIG